jgi:hypothetical protein
MSYLKVKWNRSFPDEPMLLYSELDRERWEVRKVESAGRAWDAALKEMRDLGAQHYPEEAKSEGFIPEFQIIMHGLDLGMGSESIGITASQRGRRCRIGIETNIEAPR